MVWRIEHHGDGVSALHALGFPQDPDDLVRTIRWYTPERAAIVLGSTQPESDVNLQKAHELKVDVVRRRSGGGAVLVEPDGIVWCDVIIPSDDVLWETDVGKAFYWLGEVWAKTLHQLGCPDASVYEGPLITTNWSRKVCFAGLGPGEITINNCKIVGISQRRTREAALFQCSLLANWNNSTYAQLLQLSESAQREIEESVCTLPSVDAEKVESIFEQVIFSY